MDFNIEVDAPWDAEFIRHGNRRVRFEQQIRDLVDELEVFKIGQ